MTDYSIIASYQILNRIASGGQATVYRARHTVLGRNVALKVLHPYHTADPGFVQKFAQEAQLLAQLHHPNIVEVYDANRDAATGSYYIAMEYLAGSDLETLIERQGRLAVDVVIAAALQVALALEYAHARNLIHRDIKPGNIMLLPDGTVKVLDFGIAAIVAAGQKAKTRIGTVEYMAPEHFNGNADARSDIYSLGATLYQCLTGQLPPVLATQPPTPLRQLNLSVSSALENVVLKSLGADPTTRQQTAREFTQEIESPQRAPRVWLTQLSQQTCLNCGRLNRPGARRCSACGHLVVTQPKTYAGPLNVRMAVDPLDFTSEQQPQFCWSPNGNQILVATQHLWILTDKDIQCSLRGQTRVRSKPLTDQVLIIHSPPSWSPNGRSVLYASADDGKIWSFDLVTGTRKQLTFGDGVHGQPLLAPDARHLAYCDHGPSGLVWKVIQWGNPKATHLEGHPCAGWSPGGHSFACFDRSAFAFSVFENGRKTTVGFDEQEQAYFTQVIQADWITDAQIALGVEWTAALKDGEFVGLETYLFDLEKRVLRRKWLPVAKFVAAAQFASRVAGACLRVTLSAKVPFSSYVVWTDAAQDRYHRLLSTTGTADLVVHDWSPDAMRMLLTREGGIYVVNVDDTGLQHLTDGFDPKWSPDGRYIAFLRSPQEKLYQLWVMEVQ